MGSDAETIERGFCEGDLAAIDAVVAPDFVERQRGPSSGVEALKGMVRHLRG